MWYTNYVIKSKEKLNFDYNLTIGVASQQVARRRRNYEYKRKTKKHRME